MSQNVPTYQKIHPYKFLMWLAIGSLLMMFAGFTSAYLVQKSQKNWYIIQLPIWFYISTLVILASSAAIIVAKRQFKQGNYASFRKTLVLAFILGNLFVLFQLLGFDNLADRGLFLSGDNVASSFLYVIIGLHALHVIGGLVAFIVIIFTYFSKSVHYYSITNIDILALYWHFVDLLWLYLFVFFLVQSW